MVPGYPAQADREPYPTETCGLRLDGVFKSLVLFLRAIRRLKQHLVHSYSTITHLFRRPIGALVKIILQRSGSDTGHL